MVKLLKTFCNKDNLQIHILRLCLKCVLLGRNDSQISLFVYGPGRTGKSTLGTFLYQLLSGNSCVITMDRQFHLAGLSKFDLAGLMGRRLILMPDVDLEGSSRGGIRPHLGPSKMAQAMPIEDGSSRGGIRLHLRPSSMA